MKEKLVKLGLEEELAQKVVDNLGTVVDGEYIPKSRFNEVNNELKTANETIKERDKQLESLKNSNEDIEDLKKKIGELQETNKTAKEEADKALKVERKSNAIKLELINEVHNPNITMSLLKMDDIVMDDNGKVKSGLKEQLDGLKKTDNYLFIPEKTDEGENNNNSFQIKGATPKDGEAGNEGKKLGKDEQLAKSLAEQTNKGLKTVTDNTYFQ